MMRSVRWVTGFVAVALVAGYTITYVLVGRFMDECWQPDWGLDEDED